MKEKVFSFILGGVLGFLMVCSMIAAFDYVCDLRDTEPETEAQTQTPAQEFNCRERLRHKAARG